MRKTPVLVFSPSVFILSVALCLACAGTPSPKSYAELSAPSMEVETGKSIPVSFRVSIPGGPPLISWSAEAGELVPTRIDNEVDFIAPSTPGKVVVRATAKTKSDTLSSELSISVVPAGALKKTVEVIVEVDTSTLKNVWVDAAHPAESFVPPLRIKGTFTLDIDSGEASAGGSWPVYDMFDDGTHGDRVAGDGIWTERFVFKRSSAKVYFAFDDGNAYRVGFESGLAWRFKLVWRGVDEAGAGEVSDANNLFFVPDRDQIVAWTAEMAAKSGMYAAPAR